MLEFVKGGCNVAWRGQVDCSVDVVPVECDSAVEFADPIFSDAVVFYDAVAEMISVLLANILDSKSVRHKGEPDQACF